MVKAFLEAKGMGINDPVIFLKDAVDFDPGVGEFIALEVAMGGSVRELHEVDPERIPSPIVVNRWRRRHPEFDLLMIEAEEAKAEGLVDEILGIADDGERLAAQAGNAIKARQWLAGKLHKRFGEGKERGEVAMGGIMLMSDEQLMAIAAMAGPQLVGPEVIEGEVEISDE